MSSNNGGGYNTGYGFSSSITDRANSPGNGYGTGVNLGYGYGVAPPNRNLTALSTPVIIGIAVGGTAGLAAIIITVAFLVARKRRSNKKNRQRPNIRPLQASQPMPAFQGPAFQPFRPAPPIRENSSPYESMVAGDNRRRRLSVMGLEIGAPGGSASGRSFEISRPVNLDADSFYEAPLILSEPLSRAGTLSERDLGSYQPRPSNPSDMYVRPTVLEYPQRPQLEPRPTVDAFNQEREQRRPPLMSRPYSSSARGLGFDRR